MRSSLAKILQKQSLKKRKMSYICNLVNFFKFILNFTLSFILVYKLDSLFLIKLPEKRLISLYSLLCV